MTNKELSMGRLDTIATRQRSGRARDILFAALVAVAAALSLTSMSVAHQTAIHAHVAHN